MTKTLKTLYEFSSHSLDPHALVSRSLSAADFESWRVFIDRLNALLRQKLIEYLLSTVSTTEKKTWLSSVQQHLLLISDILNTCLFRKKKVWKNHPSCEGIRSHYLHSLSCIEETLEFARQTFPDYYDSDLKFTDFQLKRVVPELRKILFDFKELLTHTAISQRLISIVVGGLQVVIDNHPSKNDVQYINHLHKEVSSIPDLDEAAFVKILSEIDFNQPEFYLYQIHSLDDRLFTVHGLHEQRELLFQEKSKLQFLKPDERFRLHPQQSPLLVDLGRYFREREEALEALLEIRRAASRDKVSADQAFRILMDMTVPQLALFFRIQMEVGLMLKDQISEVFNFVAQHFYTDKAHFISSTNMLKLSTTVEFNTVLKVYDMLSVMSKWLDEQFGVSNYSR